MEKIADHVEIRVIIYDWDDPEAIKKKLFDFIQGINTKKEKIYVEVRKGKGLVSGELITYRIKLDKWKHIKIFLRNLLKKLDEETRREIIKKLDKIVDDKGTLFLRFDKDYLVGSNKLKLVDHGDVFHIHITFRTFPKSKEKVIDTIKKFLSGEWGIE